MDRPASHAAARHLPGASSGQMIAYKYVKNVDIARMAFGQSVSVSPVQLLTAAAAAVNGGELLRPHIVSAYLQRAFTVIFMATIVIWFLQSFSFQLNLVTDQSQSILGQVASVVAPVFEPLGFGDWRIATSLVGGFLAKESVVSTLSVLFGEGVDLSTIMTASSALSLMVFCLLYTPCVAAIAAIRRELGGKDAMTVVIAQCAIAYVVAWMVSVVVGV